jgi:hypothetical protein
MDSVVHLQISLSVSLSLIGVDTPIHLNFLRSDTRYKIHNSANRRYACNNKFTADA